MSGDSQERSRIVTLHEHVDLQANEALPALRNAVKPIFAVTRGGNPVFWGTGVLVAVAGEHFLLTAAHVIHDPSGDIPEGARTGVAVTFGSATHVELTGRVHRTVPPDGKPCEADLVDVAVIELTPAEVTAIDDAKFLGMNDIDVRDHRAPRRGYLLVGYPATKQKLNLTAATFRPVRFPYFGFEVRDGLYKKLGYARESNLAVKFNRKKLWVEGRVGAAPEPRGTSGGGWWRIDNPFGPITEDRQPKLVALMSKHYPGSTKVLLAVRVSLAVQLLRYARPELAGQLPDVSFLPAIRRWRTVPAPFVPLT